MQLLNDILHLTFIAADMRRLIAFYEHIFGACRSHRAWSAPTGQQLSAL